MIIGDKDDCSSWLWTTRSTFTTVVHAHAPTIIRNSRWTVAFTPPCRRCCDRSSPSPTTTTTTIRPTNQESWFPTMGAGVPRPGSYSSSCSSSFWGTTKTTALWAQPPSQSSSSSSSSSNPRDRKKAPPSSSTASYYYHRNQRLKRKKEKQQQQQQTNTTMADESTMQQQQEQQQQEQKKAQLVQAVGASMASLQQQVKGRKLSNPKNNKNNYNQKKRPWKSTTKSNQTKATTMSTTPRTAQSSQSNTNNNLWLNPFEAGQQLRRTMDTAWSTFPPTTRNSHTLRDSLYYLEDRLSSSSSSSRSSSKSSSSWWDETDLDTDEDEEEEDDDYVPEVLVVCGNLHDNNNNDHNQNVLGPLLVQRLLRGLQGEFCVRVLVPDLYTRTLSQYGTGVTYSPAGRLHSDLESLELAVTDVDKIVYYTTTTTTQNGTTTTTTSRAKDSWQGLQNLIQAYQTVRHADYGTSQAAKRTLFKFGRRRRQPRQGQSPSSSRRGGRGVDDHALFSVWTGSDDENDDDPRMDGDDTEEESMYANKDKKSRDYANDSYDETDSSWSEFNDTDVSTSMNKASISTSSSSSSSSQLGQVQWMRNKFDHGVFVGRLPVLLPSSSSSSSNHARYSQAAIFSSRLRSRDAPDQGIDLAKAQFGGFILRVCSDGGTYQAICRTGLYDTRGIEYVCNFTTVTKQTTTTTGSNQTVSFSRNKFTTVRLPFERFQPVHCRRPTHTAKDETTTEEPITLDDVPAFVGQDVRHIGFRFQTASNLPLDLVPPASSSNTDGDTSATDTSRLLHRLSSNSYYGYSNYDYNKVFGNDPQVPEKSFYLAFTYIKLYRLQPEPEFVHVSDARIPPKVSPDMIRHEEKRLVVPTNLDRNDRSNLQKEDETEHMSSSTTSYQSLDGASGRLGAGTRAIALEDGKGETITEEQHEDNNQDHVPLANAGGTGNGETSLLQERDLYYKFMEEDILKKSGLAYAVVRIPSYYGEEDQVEAARASLQGIKLSASPLVPQRPHDKVAVTHDQVAQVCVSALLDPNALNKSFYIRPKQRATTSLGRGPGESLSVDTDQQLADQFKSLPPDSVTS